ncbi:MAG: helix-turn-helix domain-containing protein [Actinomycetota bacterium]
MDSLRTSEVEEYRAAVSSTFVPLRVEPTTTDRPFSATIDSVAMGPVRLTQVIGSAQTVLRTERELADGSTSDIKISYIRRGTAYLRQGSTATRLQPGTAALYHCDAGYDLAMPHDFDQIVFQLPREALHQMVPVTAGEPIVLRAGNEMFPWLRSTVADLLPLDRTGGIVGSRLRSAGRAVTDLLALGVGNELGRPTTAAVMRRKVRHDAMAHIRARLGDPLLTPATVAAAVGVSRRQLYSVFADHGQTVNQAIIAERIDRAHRRLSDPTPGPRPSVTEVAMAVGFKSSSHFARRFTAHHGDTPSDVAERARSADHDGGRPRR